MTAAQCGNCKYWIKRVEGEHGWGIGLGRCGNVPKFHDVTQASEDDSNIDSGTEVLKPQHLGVKAVAIDGSGYRAELLTMKDFGCTSFKGYDEDSSIQ